MPLDYLPIMEEAAGTRRQVVASSQPGWQPVAKPLASARVALLTSAALRRAGQPPFEPPQDASYRVLPADPAVADLVLDHHAPVGADARRDVDVVFPRTALAALARRGVVGEVAPSCLSFMGGIRLHREIEEELAPALARELAAQGADLAILAPY
jgi:D-proline reductase (dithiol) PrdB